MYNAQTYSLNDLIFDVVSVQCYPCHCLHRETHLQDPGSCPTGNRGGYEESEGGSVTDNSSCWRTEYEQIWKIYVYIYHKSILWPIFLFNLWKNHVNIYLQSINFFWQLRSKTPGNILGGLTLMHVQYKKYQSKLMSV